jgi:hypothetical protein
MATSANILHKLYSAPFVTYSTTASETLYCTKNCEVFEVTTAGAEARTLAQPTKAGLTCRVVLDVYVGALTLTVTGGWNEDSDTAIVFGDAGDWAEFASFKVGTSYYWRLVASEGVSGVPNNTGMYWDGTYMLPGDNAGMWANCPSPADPRYHSLVHEYFNDFRGVAADLDVTNEWTATEVGAGGAPALTADALCGTATLTTDANDNDAQQIVLNQLSFQAALGKKLWYETYFKINTAAKHIQSDWLVGLIGAGENLVAVADILPANGIVFNKDDGDANIDLTTSDNGTNVASAAVGTALTTANTWYRLGYHFDGGATGSGIITPYINGVAGTPITTAAYATMTTLSPVFLLRNGEAGAVVMTIDYVKVVQLR